MKTRVKHYAVWLGLLFGSALGAAAVPVTFQVDLAAQTALGNFNPAIDTVLVSGQFNSWATDFTLAAGPANTNIYQGTTDVSGAVGSAVQYKFIMSTAGGLVWEGNVGPGGADGNRSFTLAGGDQTLPVVFFNNVTNSTTVTTPVTFQVNMGVQTALGNRSFSVASTNLQTVPLVFFNGINNLGLLTMSSISGGQATVSWNANPSVRLQNATSLAADAWQDVANTAGQGSTTVPVGPGQTFFRLKAP